MEFLPLQNVIARTFASSSSSVMAASCGDFSEGIGASSRWSICLLPAAYCLLPAALLPTSLTLADDDDKSILKMPTYPWWVLFSADPGREVNEPHGRELD